jgi:hypothetical protein
MDSVRIVQRVLLFALASFLAVLSFLLTQREAVAQKSAAERIPANCRITLPADGEFVPPSSILAGRAPMEDQFGFGTEKLWSVLPRDGTWRDPVYVDPSSSGHLAEFAYTGRLRWFRLDPSFSEKHGPLTVTGKRLDGPAPSFTESLDIYAARLDDNAMLMGGVAVINIPTFGCWEITGRYKDQELNFTVWVARPLEQYWPSTPDAPPPKAMPPRRIQVDGATQAKLLAYHTIPELPPAAKVAGILGTVVLHAIIFHGSPRDLQYVSGPPPLVQAAIDAAKWWRYMVDPEMGLDTEVDTTIDILFSPSHE